MAEEIIVAPIPGKIVRVNVSEGDAVEEGDEVCVLESMKMENPIISPVTGKVKEVKITADQFIEGGKPMVVIEC